MTSCSPCRLPVSSPSLKSTITRCAASRSSSLRELARTGRKQTVIEVGGVARAVESAPAPAQGGRSPVEGCHIFTSLAERHEKGAIGLRPQHLLHQGLRGQLFTGDVLLDRVAHVKQDTELQGRSSMRENCRIRCTDGLIVEYTDVVGQRDRSQVAHARRPR